MKELDDVIKVVREAGCSVMSFYKSGAQVNYKADNAGPVTEADMAAQEVIFKGLSHYGYPFLSEEKVDDFARLKHDKIWVVDPLDGTKSFLDKKPEFTVMVGLVEKGRVVLGVVFAPAKNQLYFGVENHGSFVEDNSEAPKKIQVSRTSKFNKSKILVSRHHLRETEIKLAERLGVIESEPFGSAGYKMCVIAEGSAELYVNTSPRTAEWDVCAADIILTEAGGMITDMKGQGISYNKSDPINHNGFVVSNSILHEQLINGIGSISK